MSRDVDMRLPADEPEAWGDDERRERRARRVRWED
jgi:hypothetical protein